jgi:hypothetical protein
VNEERKIEIIKPFGEAFELTKRILFQPFDFTKWLVIGFAAFLSGHFSGTGFNPMQLANLQGRRSHEHISAPDLESWKPWWPILILSFVIFIFALVVVFAWLKGRGNFIFTDCIVRNRGAIAEPWREYRREGNSYFLFTLTIGFGAMFLVGLIAAAVVVPFGIYGQGRSNHEMAPIFIVLIIVFALVWVCFAVLFGLISYFMIPVMYIRRCRAFDAFRDTARLVFDNGGPFVFFCLFAICLLMGVGMVGGIATCLTCCLALLPYVGTVILLPIFVCLRAFGLCFIRQFGPEYDVWRSSTPEPPPLPV